MLKEALELALRQVWKSNSEELISNLALLSWISCKLLQTYLAILFYALLEITSLMFRRVSESAKQNILERLKRK